MRARLYEGPCSAQAGRWVERCCGLAGGASSLGAAPPGLPLAPPLVPPRGSPSTGQVSSRSSRERRMSHTWRPRRAPVLIELALVRARTRGEAQLTEPPPCSGCTGLAWMSMKTGERAWSTPLDGGNTRSFARVKTRDTRCVPAGQFKHVFMCADPLSCNTASPHLPPCLYAHNQVDPAVRARPLANANVPACPAAAAGTLRCGHVQAFCSSAEPQQLAAFLLTRISEAAPSSKHRNERTAGGPQRGAPVLPATLP